MELLARLSRIGVKKGDDDYIIVKKQFLVYQGAGMSLGGILWGTLLLIFNYPSPAVIPYGYTLITIINFYVLWKHKNFEVARFIQMTISLLLPFFLQWSLGGYNESGGTMIWSLLALVSSATYQERIGNVLIIVLFAALTVFSLIFDPYFEQNYNMGVSEGVSLIFLVVNILFVSTMVFLLVLYFERENQSNLRKLHKSYTKLINSQMVEWVEKWNQIRSRSNEATWEIRIGIHTGELVAGVIGSKKFAYDVWGDAVNVASRMESSGEPGKINISSSTYEIIKNEFKADYRGEIEVKNRGSIGMYLV